MSEKKNEKKRLAHIGKLSSTCLAAEANLHTDDYVYSIMKSMDTFHNSEKNIISYQQLQEFRSQKQSSNSNSSICNGRPQSAKLPKKFFPEKVFPLMAKCQKNMKYLKKNRCIPKPRAHVGHVPKPPKPVNEKRDFLNYLTNKKVAKQKEPRKVTKEKDVAKITKTRSDDKKVKKNYAFRNNISNSEDETLNFAESTSNSKHFEDEAVKDTTGTESDTAFEKFMKRHSVSLKIRRKRCSSPASDTSTNSDMSSSLQKDKDRAKRSKKQSKCKRRKLSEDAPRTISKMTVRNLSESSMDSFGSESKKSGNSKMSGINTTRKSGANLNSKSKQPVNKFQKSSFVSKSSDFEINFRSEDEASLNYESCDDTLNHDSSDSMGYRDSELCQEKNNPDFYYGSPNFLPDNITEQESVDIEDSISASLDSTNYLALDSQNVDSKLHSRCFVSLERHPVLEQRVRTLCSMMNSVCPILNNNLDDCVVIDEISSVPAQQVNAKHTIPQTDLKSASLENSDLKLHNGGLKSQSTVMSQNTSNSSALCIEPEIDECVFMCEKSSLSYGNNSNGISQPTKDLPNNQNVNACRESNFCSLELPHEPNAAASIAESFSTEEECFIICEKPKIDPHNQVVELNSDQVSEGTFLQTNQIASFTNDISPQILSVVSLAANSEPKSNQLATDDKDSESHISETEPSNVTKMNSTMNESADSDIEIIPDFNIANAKNPAPARVIEDVPSLKEGVTAISLTHSSSLNEDKITEEEDCIIIEETSPQKNNSVIHNKNSQSLGYKTGVHKEQPTCNVSSKTANVLNDAEGTCGMSKQLQDDNYHAGKTRLCSTDKSEVESCKEDSKLTQNSKIFEILKQIDFDSIKKVLNQSPTVNMETFGFNNPSKGVSATVNDGVLKNSLNVDPSLEINSESSITEVDNEIVILSVSKETNRTDNEMITGVAASSDSMRENILVNEKEMAVSNKSCAAFKNSELSTELKSLQENEGIHVNNATILRKQFEIDGLEIVSENLSLQSKNKVSKDELIQEVVPDDLSIQSNKLTTDNCERRVVDLTRTNNLTHSNASAKLPLKCTEKVQFSPDMSNFYRIGSKEPRETLGANNTSKSEKSLVLHNFKNKALDHVRQDLKSQKELMLPNKGSFKPERDNEGPSDELDILATSAIRDLDLQRKKSQITPLLDLYKVEFKRYMEIKCTEKNVSAGLKLLEDKQAKILAHISTSINNVTQYDPCFNKIAKHGKGHQLQATSVMEVRDNRLNTVSEIKAVPKSGSSLDETNSDIKKIFHPSVVQSAQEMVTSQSAQPSLMQQEVYKHLMNSKCAECGKQALAACQGCTKVYYCSSECGEKFWFKGHSETCTR